MSGVRNEELNGLAGGLAFECCSLFQFPTFKVDTTDKPDSTSHHGLYHFVPSALLRHAAKGVPRYSSLTLSEVHYSLNVGNPLSAMTASGYFIGPQLRAECLKRTGE